MPETIDMRHRERGSSLIALFLMFLIRKPITDNRCGYACSLFEILQTLYFAIYGLVDIKHFELKAKHDFTQFVGKLMFGTYSLITIVVLLNMLIAMLSNSYQYISVSYLSIYTTIAALSEKICPQNRTDFYPSGLNSTPIIAKKILRLHVAYPRPLDRSLFAVVLCFLRQKIKKNLHRHSCDF